MSAKISTVSASATRTKRLLGALLIAGLTGVTGGGAQEEPVGLPVGEAKDLLGSWVLEMESPQGTFDADLRILDVEGMVRGELEMPRFGSQSLDQVSKTEKGIRLSFQSTFGDQSFNMNLDVAKVGDGLEGQLAEENGLFQIPFTGITEQAALARDSDGSSRRRRGRFGPAETKIAVGEKEIKVRFDPAKTGDEDYGQVTEPQEGTVVAFLESRPAKLFTDVDLHFGETVVETENVAENYPGVYSLWLKRVGDGWHLLFNELADVWGTQHDPEHDVAEIPLAVADLEEEAEELVVELEEAEDGGLLKIAWGTKEWSVPFSTAD